MRPSSFKALNARCEVVACLERLETRHRLAGGVLIERGAVAPVLHEQHAVFLGEGSVVVILHAALFGENDPEMMWLTTMNPETRRLIKVMPEEAEATARSFDLLLGDTLQGRKDHIAENGYKYLEMIDVS